MAKRAYQRRHQLLIIEQYLKSLSMDHTAFLLGMCKRRVKEVVDNWEENNNFVIVESKINNYE